MPDGKQRRTVRADPLPPRLTGRERSGPRVPAPEVTSALIDALMTASCPGLCQRVQVAGIKAVGGGFF